MSTPAKRIYEIRDEIVATEPDRYPIALAYDVEAIVRYLEEAHNEKLTQQE